MGNLNPYYNESFIFVVEQEQLRVGSYWIQCFVFHKEAQTYCFTFLSAIFKNIYIIFLYWRMSNNLEYY